MAFTTPDYSPKDKNAKLYAAYGSKAKYLAAKKKRDEAKASATKSAKPYVDANKALNDELNNVATGLYTKLTQAKLDPYPDPAYIQALKDKITKVKGKMKVNYTYIYLYDTKIRDAEIAFEKAKVIGGSNNNNNNNNNNNDNNDTADKPKPGKGPWHFNAPLIAAESYIRPGGLPQMLPAGPSVGNAYDFWTKETNMGGKGAIQMDRQTNTLELKANAQKEAKKKGLKFDGKMYGFKFHYNPTTVNMSWSGMMGANPVYEAAGLDPAVPMATNLFTGTVSFDIILNRIQDVALLNWDGTYKYGKNPYGETTVDIEDLREITQKGTMYDLEYLFRTLHGYAFYTNFQSNLMGKTNDPGWLPVRPVELHLGKKLRYRVRVSGLEVVHKIFSPRMIPILSVVTITCMRYWDGPMQGDPKK